MPDDVWGASVALYLNVSLAKLRMAEGKAAVYGAGSSTLVADLREAVESSNLVLAIDPDLQKAAHRRKVALQMMQSTPELPLTTSPRKTMKKMRK